MKITELDFRDTKSKIVEELYHGRRRKHVRFVRFFFHVQQDHKGCNERLRTINFVY